MALHKPRIESSQAFNFGSIHPAPESKLRRTRRMKPNTGHVVSAQLSLRYDRHRDADMLLILAC